MRTKTTTPLRFSLLLPVLLLPLMLLQRQPLSPPPCAHVPARDGKH